VPGSSFVPPLLWVFILSFILSCPLDCLNTQDLLLPWSSLGGWIADFIWRNDDRRYSCSLPPRAVGKGLTLVSLNDISRTSRHPQLPPQATRHTGHRSGYSVPSICYHHQKTIIKAHGPLHNLGHSKDPSGLLVQYQLYQGHLLPDQQKQEQSELGCSRSSLH
jgi:hypothetical protein